MCSRYRLVKEKIVITINGRQVEVTLKKRYNVAPQQTMPVLIPDLAGGAQVVTMKWGWQPAWSPQLLVNAQAETVQTKGTFPPFLQQRCLIPADGFYEWTGDKTPIMFTQDGDGLFCFAGLWLEAPGGAPPAGVPETRFIVLTTSPNESVGKVHDRMPFIVEPGQYGGWFEEAKYKEVLNSPDRRELASRAVQRALNNVKNEGAELIRPGMVQGSLF